jgi:hypothetical protein
MALPAVSDVLADNLPEVPLDLPIWAKVYESGRAIPPIGVGVVPAGRSGAIS